MDTDGSAIFFFVFVVPALGWIAINGLWLDAMAWAAVVGLCGGLLVMVWGARRETDRGKTRIAALALAMMLGGIVAANLVTPY